MITLTIDEEEALQALWWLRYDAHVGQRELYEAHGRTILGILLDVADMTSVEAQKQSPWLFGVLSSSHRSRAYAEGQNTAVGEVYIDPTVTHPVLRGRPAVYGIDVHERKPWLDWTIDAVGEDIYWHIEENVMISFERIMTR